MTDLYLSNRTTAKAYLEGLRQRLDSVLAPDTLSNPKEANLQAFYLEFKQRVQPVIEQETQAWLTETQSNNNSHLLLLKRSALVDAVVNSAFDLALFTYNQRHGSNLTADDIPVTIVARGGYGREEMYLHSDVDLKIIFQESSDEPSLQCATEVVSYFEYLFVFQDLFRTNCRTGCAEMVSQYQELDRDSLASLISLMEHRHAAGNTAVYDMFAQSILEECNLHEEELLSFCYEHKEYYESSNTVFNQEPDLHQEFSRLYWALAVARQRFSLTVRNQFELLSELLEKEKISPPAFKIIQKALSFLARVRLVLHRHQSGAQRDILSFEVREAVANDLGYEVPPFFNRYFFDSVLPLKRYSRNLFWESIAVNQKKVKSLTPQFAVNEDRRIIFQKEETNFTWDPPLSLLEVFTWVARRDYFLSYPVIRALELNLDSMSPLFLTEEDRRKVQEYFQSILRGKHFARALRYLHEFGLLEQYFIPEFKNLSGLLQDIYVHIFPTDIHILAALDALNLLDNDPDADPFLVELYQSLRDKSTIRLAVMVHDIGKGLKSEGENEELVGARAVPGILERLGYGKNLKQVRDIAFLVEKHLMMRDLMLLDPDDDGTYEMIWDLVEKDVERLKMLILLTYADRAATKMLMSQSQIDQLKYFYQNTLQHKKRASVSKPVKLEFLQMIRLPREMQSQLEVYNEFKKSREGFTTEFFFKPDQPSELIVCVKDHPSLLFKVATILAFNHMSIVDANIHTVGDNVFDVFQVYDSGQKPIEFSNFFSLQKMIKEDLRKVFVGNLPVSSLYMGRTLPVSSDENRKHNVKLKLSIIGRAVKVETHDILGTMMMETKVFTQLNMQIQRAVLNSSFGTASNIFYLRPEDVHEIMKQEDRFMTMMKQALEPLIHPEPIFPDSPAEVA